ncbi:ATP-dependent Clp protease protease subunit [Streptacidiphilus sp. BW17]|uniref:ATP-dependent Clp protease proteolytic subunit n=1 Tax=Streptacidiphilus sp. BW17 TaxID=3156274 RepID=UPI003512CB60
MPTERLRDPFREQLLEQRVVTLTGPLDDTACAEAAAELLHLDRADPGRELSLYLNSSGGALTPLLGLVDVVRSLACPVQTVCLGRAERTAAVLLAVGTPGRRVVMPQARLLLAHPDPGTEPDGHPLAAEELMHHADSWERRLRAVEALLAEATGTSRERVRHDLEHGLAMGAEGAVGYGLADTIGRRPPNG